MSASQLIARIRKRLSGELLSWLDRVIVPILLEQLTRDNGNEPSGSIGE